MKKLTLLAFAFVLAAVNTVLYADDPKIKLTFGQEYEVPKKHYPVGFIGDAARGYIQIGLANGKSVSFQKFDKNLKLVSEKFVDLKAVDKSANSVNWREVGDNYYWFFSTYNKSEKTERLFAQKINTEKGTFEGSAREIAKSDKIGGPPPKVFFFYADFSVYYKWNFVASANKKTTLVYYRIRPTEKRDEKNNDIIGFNVFDEKMNKIWGKEVKMPYTEADMDNVDYQVDGKGNVYCLAKVYDDRKSKDKTKPNYHYEILMWTKDKPDGVKIPFKFEDKFVSSALLMEDYSGRMIVAGYYSKVYRSGSSDGVFLLKLDQEQGAVTNVLKGIYEFPKELLKEFESARAKKAIDKKEAKKGDVEEPILTLRNIIINEDGTIQVYGEQYQVVSYTYYDSKGVPHTRYTYYHLDIIALNIGKDGEIAWVKKIPKQQVSGSPAGQGFSQFSYGDEKFFFFTDNPKNLNLTADQAPVTHGSGTKGTVMVVRIDNAGKMSKAVLYDAKDNKTYLDASNFDKVGEDQMITRTAQHKTSRALLLTFVK